MGYETTFYGENPNLLNGQRSYLFLKQK